MMLHLHRQRAYLWLICILVALLALTLRANTSRGATANLMPASILLPLPEGLIHSDNFGAAMDIEGDIVAVGAPDTDVNGNENQGVVYIYLRDSNDPSAYTLLKSITGSGGNANDNFGTSVELEGDTLVVGNSTYLTDAAYVFARHAGGTNNWGETQKLLRGDGKTVTYFGRTLAMHGDTLLVGAPVGKGEVFVFRRDPAASDQWTRTQILTHTLPVTLSAPLASFGAEIEFDGTRIAISAMGVGLKSIDIPPGEPVPDNNSISAVYIFEPENGEWVFSAKLFSSDIVLGTEAPRDDRFGQRIALHGDTLFVSAPTGLTNGVDTGKVFVFQHGAGTTPSLGQPGAWGEVAQLGPSDGVHGDRFGVELYPVEDALFVSAHRWGVGKVYFFRNPATSASNSLPHAQHAWQEIYGYSPSEDGTNTAFGVPIVGDGDLVFFGDKYADGSRGGVHIYPQAALFAYDPSATPPPSETPPTTMPPAEPDTCISSLPAQPTPETPTPETPGPETPGPETPTPEIPATPTPEVPTQAERHLFLPSIMGSGLAAERMVAVATPVASHAVFTGVLASGCLLITPDNLILGAVAGALTQTVRITIETTGAPPEALPDGVTPLGNFVHIAAGDSQLPTMLSPFIIGLPVPAGADTAHLTLLTLLPPTSMVDSEVTTNFWSYLPGVYDAANNLFLARLPFLLTDGTTLRLVEHPDFASPPNAPSPDAQVASTTLRGEFSVYCIRSTFARSSACSDVTADRAKALLDEIYQRMVDDSVFGFPRELRLLDSGSQIIVSEALTITPLTASYAAYLMGPKDPSCANAVGYYVPATGYLALCLNATQSMGEEEKKTFIHEMFHAIEYTYPEVRSNRVRRKDQAWVIEGMAEAAVESFAEDDKMQRSNYFGEDNLQKIDKHLTEGRWGDKPIDEYLAQDFWVYLGHSEGENLAYLGTLLDLGGARDFSLDPAMRTLFGKSLSEIYWGWVKNQAFENQYDVGPGQETPCELQTGALSTGEPVLFFAAEYIYPYETGIAFDRLPPRTAKVIEINFGDRTGGLVTVEYEGCSHLEEPTAKASCDATAQNTLRAKMYEEHESACEATNLPGYIREGQRRFDNVSSDRRYFVVVANLDPWAQKGFSITVE